MTRSQYSKSTLAIRDILVILSAIGFVSSIFIGLSKPFDSLSYLVAISIGASSVIMFGWSCYLGHSNKLTESKQLQ